MLAWESVPQYTDMAEPLFHHLFGAGDFTVKTLDMLEQMTGGTEFLNIKNSRGATMFHRIVSNASWTETEDKLDLAAWMLQKNPQLLNDPDRFGWTPLDPPALPAQGRARQLDGAFPHRRRRQA